MTNLEIVNKLVGSINPVGETNTDHERFVNLVEMCDLVCNLVIQINDVYNLNKDSQEFSVKRAADYSNNFLSKLIK